jgi:hypothetical protein
MTSLRILGFDYSEGLCERTCPIVHGRSRASVSVRLIQLVTGRHSASDGVWCGNACIIVETISQIASRVHVPKSPATPPLARSANLYHNPLTLLAVCCIARSEALYRKHDTTCTVVFPAQSMSVRRA